MIWVVITTLVVVTTLSSKVTTLVATLVSTLVTSLVTTLATTLLNSNNWCERSKHTFCLGRRQAPCRVAVLGPVTGYLARKPPNSQLAG